MDPIIYKKTHKRIHELRRYADSVTDTIGTLLYNENAKHWVTVLDDAEQADAGLSYGLPVERLLLLSQNRKVPAAFLPSSISYMGAVEDCGTYTGSGDPRENLPQPDQPKYGDMDVVYKVSIQGNIAVFYRYIQPDTTPRNWYDVYHPLHSNLRFVNGNGTVVYDCIKPSNGMYTRKIDVAIGEPDCQTPNALAINGSGKLVHALSGVSSGTYPQQDEPSDVGFGTNIYVPGIEVNATGHICNAESLLIKVPDTAANTGTVGIVKIGTVIMGIGTDNLPGTVSPTEDKPYIEVAAADHVHSASPLELTHTNAPDSTTLTYNGAVDVEYDFDNILRARLPEEAPTGVGPWILVSSGPSTTEWKRADYALNTNVRYAEGTPPVISMGNAFLMIRKVDNSIEPGKLYLVTVSLSVTVLNPSPLQTRPEPWPLIQELELKVNDESAVKTVGVPLTWNCSTAGGIPWKCNVSWIYEYSGSGTNSILYGRMRSAPENVFGVQCNSMSVVRLR